MDDASYTVALPPSHRDMNSAIVIEEGDSRQLFNSILFGRGNQSVDNSRIELLSENDTLDNYIQLLPKEIDSTYKKVSGDRWNAFYTLLSGVERQDVKKDKSESLNIDNQYAQGEEEGGTKYGCNKKLKTIHSGKFTLIPNKGGGDCLFHSLEGKNLSGDEVLSIRKCVADQWMLQKENTALNANKVVAALTQSNIEGAIKMMYGRHEVPNSVYAAMQAVPGIYAGEDELIMWCMLKNRKVIVVDENGSVAKYSNKGREEIEYGGSDLNNVLERLFSESDVALYKMLGHYQKIDV